MRNTSGRRTVPATEAAKTFGALVDRVRESGAIYQVESRGQVVAEIGPPRRRFTVGEFRALIARGPRAPAELLDAIEGGRRHARRAPASASPALSGRGGRRRR
jgi:antitoxin (DNA-binding transcriptional repressor) of toxin-antitoxin stability system